MAWAEGGGAKRPKPSPARGSAKATPEAKRWKCEACGVFEEDGAAAGSPAWKCRKCGASVGVEVGAVVAPSLPPCPPALVAARESGGRGRGLGERAGDARASRGRGAGREEEDVEVWRAFTPASIDPTKCMARMWGEGRGAQCGRAPQGAGGRYCGRHSREHQRGHGDVTGGIPAPKLAEFQREAAKIARAERAGAQAASERRDGDAQERKRGGGAVGRVRAAGLVVRLGEGQRDSEPDVDRRGAGSEAPGLVALAADAAEERGRAERERGIGDMGKAEKMAKRSAARARASDAARR